MFTVLANNSSLSILFTLGSQPMRNKRQHKTSTKDPKIKKEIDPSALSNEINGILHDTKVHGAGFESNKEGGYTPKYRVKSTLKIEIHTKTTYKEL